MNKKVLVGILILIMVMGVCFFASSEGEKLFSLDVKGLTFTSSGKWQAVAVNADFLVFDESGNPLGEITSYATSEQTAGGKTSTIAVAGGTTKLILEPQAQGGAYAFEERYEIDLTAFDSVNYPLLVYANKGLFSVQNVLENGEGLAGAVFELKTADGTVVKTLETDLAGRTKEDESVRAGEYVLSMKTAPEGTLKGADVPFSLPVYRGESDFVYLQYLSQSIPEENLALAAASAGIAAKARSLFDGAQTVKVSLTGFGLYQNTLNIEDYTLTAGGFKLLDREGAPLASQSAITLKNVSYQNAQADYALTISFFDSQGQPAGNEIVLLSGETAVVSGNEATHFSARYVNRQTGLPLLAPGFDGGTLEISLLVPSRMPHPSEAEATGIGFDVTPAWKVEGTDTPLVGETQSIALAKDAFDNESVLTAELSVDANHVATLVLGNRGGRALPAKTYDLALPAGWRLKAADENMTITRLKDFDVLTFKVDKPILPGETVTVSAQVQKAAASAEATLYVENIGLFPPTRDNPLGSLLPGYQPQTNPLRGLTKGAVYALLPVEAVNPEPFGDGETGEAVQGRIFEAASGNGAQGISVLLRVAGSAVVYQTVTDQNGQFVLYDVPTTVDARLYFQLPENMMVLPPLTDEEGGYRVTGNDMQIGIAITCSIAGTVTADGNGIKDILVKITNESGLSEPVYQTTDQTGAYRVGKLAAGKYTVSFAIDEAQKDMVALAGGGQAVTVELTEAQKEAQVSETAVLLGRLHIRAQAGATVALDKDGREWQRFSANEQGDIVISGLYPGEYEARLLLAGDWLMADKAASQNVLVTVAGGSEARITFDIIQGAHITGGLEKSGAGVTVTLEGDGESKAVSDAESIVFSNLYPGRYTVKVSYPEGVFAISDGQWEVADRQAQIKCDVAEGQTATLPNLKLQREGSVTGYIWKDGNTDGLFTQNEPGVGGVPITLERKTDSGYEVIAQTVTDSYGQYTFTRLVPGTYRVFGELGKQTAFVNTQNNSVFGLLGYTADFEVADGADVAGISGGTVTPAPLKVAVFQDSNLNGERGTYERGVQGITVEVLSADGATVLAHGITDNDGLVSFPAMMPGERRIRFNLTAGYGFTKKANNVSLNRSAIDKTDDISAVTDVITLVEGKENGASAGVVPLYRVSGRAWYDTNGDGIMQADESGQAGVEITLLPKKETGSTYTLTTDETGWYVFDRVRAGTYDMSVTANEGVMFTRYSQTGRDDRSIMTSEGKRTGLKLVAVESGKNLPEHNIGFVKQGVIEGIVFIDENANGLMDAGERPLAGAKVSLEKAATNDEMRKLVTEADGAFRFDMLRGNTYRLKVTMPDGEMVFTKTVDIDTLGNHIAQRDKRREGVLDAITLADGETRLEYVGVVYTGAISGTIYEDDDYSGDRQANEKGIAGVEVTLRNENGEIAKVKTDRNGAYAFVGLIPGMYELQMNTAKGSVYVTKGENSSMASTTESHGVSKPVQVRMGAETAHIDGGLIVPATIGGFIYQDKNDNGTQEAGEGGYQGVSVTLLDEMGNPVGASVLTGEDGLYTFSNAMPGTYSILCQLGDEERFVAGFAKSIKSGAFTVKSGQSIALPDLSAIRLAAVSGYAFGDENGNGVKDDGEKMLSGVSITLTPSRSELSALSVLTDETGTFAFADLRPGDYRMAINAPDGLVFSKDRQGAYRDYTGETSHEMGITIPMGEIQTDFTLGAVEPAAVMGILWLDENNDGMIDETERGINGMTVTLTEQNAGVMVRSVAVDASGAFEFEGLLPSVYTVSVDMPANHIPVANDYVTMTARDDGTLAQDNIILDAGELRGDILGGFLELTDWGGQVFLDHGGQYVAIEGARVNLLGENGAVLRSCVTLADGNYLFDGLLPANYYLQAELPQGYLLVSPMDNSENRPETAVKADNSNVGTSQMQQLVMGENRLSMNIAAVRPGSLGDMAWFDENGNGLQDTGERPVEGVTVTVMRGEEAIASAQTNAYGYYMISDLYPSVYSIKVSFPQGLTPTTPRDDIKNLSSVLPTAGGQEVTVQGVEILSGIVNRNFDLGFVLTEAGKVPDAVKEIKKQAWN